MNRRDFIKLAGKGVVAAGVVAVTGMPKKGSYTLDWIDTLHPNDKAIMEMRRLGIVFPDKVTVQTYSWEYIQ